MYESGVFNIMLFLILLLILFLFIFGTIWNASFGKVEPLRENPSPDIDSYSASESVYLAQYKDRGIV